MSAGDTTQGRRIEPGDGIFWRPGDYWKGVSCWMAATPNDMLANLSAHSMTEHDDGTITVAPSILTTGGEGASWHGFLEHGVWREVP